MKHGLATVIFAAAVLIICSVSITAAQDDSTVRISFDRESKRIDIVSGKMLPNYTKAQRSSLQFFNGRFDKPENGFWYYFDGRRFQSADRTFFIRKLKYIGTWIIAGSGRWGESDQTKSGIVPTSHPNTNCVIEHHAVSFIPLNVSTGKPDPRVYVLLDDLELIQWHPYNHWLVSMPQKELESLKGIMY